LTFNKNYAILGIDNNYLGNKEPQIQEIKTLSDQLIVVQLMVAISSVVPQWAGLS